MTPDLAMLDAIAERVYGFTSATPQISWPLLNQRLGTDVWVKHENHNLTGSFKVRGGLIYLQNLVAKEPGVKGVCAATRGNFGQSVAYAAGRLGIHARIVVPKGNSPDKNAAMEALGARLVVAGEDFDESIQMARQIADEEGLHLMPSFDLALAMGVSTYGLELLRSRADLSRVYVPIGLGSGVCGMVMARNALGLQTEIVGVVSKQFNAYSLSFQRGKVVGTGPSFTMADGLAVRNPAPEALDIMLRHVSRIVEVTDAEITAAMSALFDDTHNVAEGAGAAALAALCQDQQSTDHRLDATDSVAVVLTGGNVTKQLYLAALMQNQNA